MELIAASVFYEVAALLALGAAAGLVALLLRQPLIVGLIGAGILAGPGVLGLARSDAHIDLLAELGIAVLLFLVGLKLDIEVVFLYFHTVTQSLVDSQLHVDDEGLELHIRFQVDLFFEVKADK